MKTAISIPDRLFEEAEREAKRAKVSRSKLFAQAMEAFLRTRRDHRLTKAANRAIAGLDTRLDPALAELQWRTLQKNADPEDKW